MVASQAQGLLLPWKLPAHLDNINYPSVFNQPSPLSKPNYHYKIQMHAVIAHHGAWWWWFTSSNNMLLGSVLPNIKTLPMNPFSSMSSLLRCWREKTCRKLFFQPWVICTFQRLSKLLLCLLWKSSSLPALSLYPSHSEVNKHFFNFKHIPLHVFLTCFIIQWKITPVKYWSMLVLNGKPGLRQVPLPFNW